jgi:hypothetical protein
MWPIHYSSLLCHVKQMPIISVIWHFSSKHSVDTTIQQRGGGLNYDLRPTIYDCRSLYFMYELSFGRVVFLSSCRLVELVLVDLPWSICHLVELSLIRLYGTQLWKCFCNIYYASVLLSKHVHVKKFNWMLKLSYFIIFIFSGSPLRDLYCDMLTVAVKTIRIRNRASLVNRINWSLSRWPFCLFVDEEEL